MAGELQFESIPGKSGYFLLWLNGNVRSGGGFTPYLSGDRSLYALSAVEATPGTYVYSGTFPVPAGIYNAAAFFCNSGTPTELGDLPSVAQGTINYSGLNVTVTEYASGMRPALSGQVYLASGSFTAAAISGVFIASGQAANAANVSGVFPASGIGSFAGFSGLPVVVGNYLSGAFPVLSGSITHETVSGVLPASGFATALQVSGVALRSDLSGNIVIVGNYQSGFHPVLSGTITHANVSGVLPASGGFTVSLISGVIIASGQLNASSVSGVFPASGFATSVQVSGLARVVDLSGNIVIVSTYLSGAFPVLSGTINHATVSGVQIASGAFAITGANVSGVFISSGGVTAANVSGLFPASGFATALDVSGLALAAQLSGLARTSDLSGNIVIVGGYLSGQFPTLSGSVTAANVSGVQPASGVVRTVDLSGLATLAALFNVMPIRLTKNMPFSGFPFAMTRSGGVLPYSGSVTISRTSGNGLASIADSPVNTFAAGWCRINLTAADLADDAIGFQATGPGANQLNFTIITQRSGG